MAITRRQTTRNRDECESPSVCSSNSARRLSNSRIRGRGRSNRTPSTNNNLCGGHVPELPQSEIVAPVACITERTPQWSCLRCCCFYLIYILTCLLLSILIFSVSTFNSKTMLQLEGLSAELHTLRNEILVNQKYNNKPPRPPAIDSNTLSNDLIQIIDSAVERENLKVLNELFEIKEILQRIQSAGSKSCDSQFDLLLKKLDAMKKGLSKHEIGKTALTLSNKKLGSQQVIEERVDYAAESLGGEIYSTDDTKLLKMYYFGSIFGWIENTPRMILQPSIFPGECYGFAGQNGSVVIKLMGRVFIDSVTIGHIPKELSPSGDLNTAPRNITVSGLTTPDDSQPTELGTMEYDIEKNEIFQTFTVETGIVSFRYVRFNFTSNYGHLNHTCVYRVRVHGKLDDR